MQLLLLQNKDLLPYQTQRLAAVYLVYEMYKQESIVSTPFAPLFVHILSSAQDLCPPKTSREPDVFQIIPRFSQAEKEFIYWLISSGTNKDPKDPRLKKTPLQIIQSDPTGQAIDVRNLLIAPLVQRAQELPYVARSGISCIVSDSEQRPLNVDLYGKPSGLALVQADVQRSTAEALLTGDAPHVDKTLRPELVRLAPPLFLCANELIWMQPSDAPEHRVLWDPLLAQPPAARPVHNVYAVVRGILARACREPLAIDQQQKLLMELSRDPRLVLHSGLSFEKGAAGDSLNLPALVEQNPLIAIEVLLRLMRANPAQINDYLKVLVNMEMSLHSMEVVNRLTSEVKLPKEFVSLYVSNCIQACENMKNQGDRALQSRLVRLVCVFLQSLIRNKAIDLQEVYVDVQAFCLNFSRIREAAQLFRILKAVDPGEAAGPSSMPISDLSDAPGGPLGPSDTSNP